MKNMSQLLADWRQASNEMQKLVNDKLPRIIGNESVRVVKQNFDLGGYDSGSGVNGWVERSAKTNKRYDRRTGMKGTVYSSSNPLLVQTHNLKDSVNYRQEGNGVFIGTIKNLVPYAKRMNEGGGGVPARKFIPTESEGANPKILKRVHKKILSERDKAMQAFKK